MRGKESENNHFIRANELLIFRMNKMHTKRQLCLLCDLREVVARDRNSLYSLTDMHEKKYSNDTGQRFRDLELNEQSARSPEDYEFLTFALFTSQMNSSSR